MAASNDFRNFEQAGWTDNSVAISYHRQVSQVTRGCIPELIRAARVKSGDKVLDVACGAGYVAAAARDKGADATGVDFSATQIELAKQIYPEIQFMEGDAEALPFTDGKFDVVLNSFGLPHVSNPDNAASEAYRVLNSGGRFAYASWCEATKCVALSMIYDAIRTHGSLDVGLPPGPNFFGYGELSYATDLLIRAGFTNVSAVEVPLVWRFPSPDALFEVISSATVRAAAVLKRQNKGSLASIKNYLRERVTSFKQDAAYVVPSPALVVTARKL